MDLGQRIIRSDQPARLAASTPGVDSPFHNARTEQSSETPRTNCCGCFSGLRRALTRGWRWFVNLFRRNPATSTPPQAPLEEITPIQDEVTDPEVIQPQPEETPLVQANPFKFKQKKVGGDYALEKWQHLWKDQTSLPSNSIKEIWHAKIEDYPWSDFSPLTRAYCICYNLKPSAIPSVQAVFDSMTLTCRAQNELSTASNCLSKLPPPSKIFLHHRSLEGSPFLNFHFIRRHHFLSGDLTFNPLVRNRHRAPYSETSKLSEVSSGGGALALASLEETIAHPFYRYIPEGARYVDLRWTLEDILERDCCVLLNTEGLISQVSFLRQYQADLSVTLPVRDQEMELRVSLLNGTKWELYDARAPYPVS